MALSYAARISVPSGVLISQVAGESVILNIKTERYFGLDEVGTMMWTALTNSETIQAAYERLLGEFDVEPQRLRGDLDLLINNLAERGLIEVID